MHLVQVPPEVADAIWPKVNVFIARACEHTYGTDTPETVLSGVKAQRKQLWIIVDDARQVIAAGTTSLQVGDTGRLTLFVELLGGDNMKTWFGLKSELEQWAKEKEGCSDVFFRARKGWARHLEDYQITHYLMHKDL